MADLDYAKVTGRFGLSIGDTTSDPDLDPDLVWCTEGRVLLTPLNTFVKVPAGHPMPFTMGNAVYEAQISGSEYVDPTGGGNDGAGHLVFNGPFGQPFVNVVDLTSDKVNPKIGSDSATHRVTFIGVKAAMPGTGIKVDVGFPSFTARITAAGAAGDGVNDLTLLAPILPGELQPIYQGPAGVSVTAAAVDGTGKLVLTMSDGSTKNAGAMPGLSASSVAGYITTPGSPVAAALATTIAQQIPAAVAAATEGIESGLGATSVIGGSVSVGYATHYGVTAAGVPYYDTDAVTPGEEATLIADPTSASGLSLVKIGA